MHHYWWCISTAKPVKEKKAVNQGKDIEQEGLGKHRSRKEDAHSMTEIG